MTIKIARAINLYLAYYLHILLSCFRVWQEREFFQCTFYELVKIVDSVCGSNLFNHHNTAVTQLIERINNMRKEDFVPFIPPCEAMPKRKLPTIEPKNSKSEITFYFKTT